MRTAAPPAQAMLRLGTTAAAETRRATAAQATQWIEERVVDLREQVRDAEAAVADFRASSLISDGSSLDIITQQMIELNNQLVTARVERVAAA